MSSLKNKLCPICKLDANENCIGCNKCNKPYHWDCSDLSEFEIKLHKNNRYKPWRCRTCIDKYCIKCNKTFPVSNYNSICCDKCQFWYHFSCSQLDITEFETHQKNLELKWSCNSCQNKYCKKCDISTRFKNSVKCSNCCGKFHNKCAGITKQNSQNTQSATWNCRDCSSQIFPFHNIDNKSLIKMHENYPKKYVSTSIVTNEFKNCCSICDKKLIMPNKGIPCTNCKCLVHVKCTNIKHISKEYHTFKGNWQCSACIKTKFAFTDIDNKNLKENSFNSNILLNRKYKSKITIEEELKLMLSHSKQSNWHSYSHPNINETFNITSDEIDQFNCIKPNFMYYDVEKFNKLQKSWQNHNKLGIFHTNICSLQANIEDMEDLLVDLGFSFDILALTETWNPEEGKDKFLAKNIDGYHDYYGVTGSTRKGGCGVYIKNTLISIPRTDLEFKITTNGQETETCWIELSENNNKNIIVGVIYRHPSKQNEQFFENMNKVLKKVNKEKKRVILCGDFNFDLLNYDNDKNVSTFLNNMLEHNFQPNIIEPTRITNTNKPSLVDNIFTNIFEDSISGNILEHISYDHLPNFLILDQGITERKKIYMKRDKKNLTQKFSMGNYLILY